MFFRSFPVMNSVCNEMRSKKASLFEISCHSENLLWRLLLPKGTLHKFTNDFITPRERWKEIIRILTIKGMCVAYKQTILCQRTHHKLCIVMLKEALRQRVSEKSVCSLEVGIINIQQRLDSNFDSEFISVKVSYISFQMLTHSKRWIISEAFTERRSVKCLIKWKKFTPSKVFLSKWEWKIWKLGKPRRFFYWMVEVF